MQTLLPADTRQWMRCLFSLCSFLKTELFEPDILRRCWHSARHSALGKNPVIFMCVVELKVKYMWKVLKCTLLMQNKDIFAAATYCSAYQFSDSLWSWTYSPLDMILGVLCPVSKRSHCLLAVYFEHVWEITGNGCIKTQWGRNQAPTLLILKTVVHFSYVHACPKRGIVSVPMKLLPWWMLGKQGWHSVCTLCTCTGCCAQVYKNAEVGGRVNIYLQVCKYGNYGRSFCTIHIAKSAKNPMVE